ncbi:hypothetical protein ACHAWF_018160 [Thalassiosira exigua]
MFLRIAKSGSTALSSFLYHLPSVRILYGLLEDDVPEMILGKCMFALPRAANGTTNQTEADGDGDDDDDDDNGPSYGRKDPCVHLWYEDAAEDFAEVASEFSAAVPVEYGLHSSDGRIRPRWFSMVRDPYERLVSLFHYSKRDHLDHGFTSEQRKYIRTNDFEAWMRSLATDQHRFVAEQYMRFNDTDLEGALTLISGDDPTIVPLINECFEASLRLLLERFRLSENETIGREYIAAFARYSREQRPNAGRYDRALSVNETLRGRAMEWFGDDFEFYDHAVRQFRSMMDRSFERSGGDSTHFDSCKYFSRASSAWYHRIWSGR